MKESKEIEIEDKDDSFEVDAAVEDLLRAEKHKKNPELMEKVRAKLGEKQEAISSIAGLKKKRAKLQMEDEKK